MALANILDIVVDSRLHLAHGLRVAVVASLLTGAAGTALAHEGSRKAEVIQEGIASFYGDRFRGKPTASGEPFDPLAFTAAHKELPFGTRVLVTRLDTGRQVEVRINDRGPFIEGRVIDLSRRAARKLGMLDRGTAPVELTAVP